MSFNLQSEIKKSFLTVELSIETEVDGELVTDVFYNGPIPAVTLDLHENVVNSLIVDSMDGNVEGIESKLMTKLIHNELMPDVKLSKRIVTSIGDFKPNAVTKYIKAQLKELDIDASKDIVERLEGKMYVHFYGQLKAALEERNQELASQDTPR